MQDKYDYEPALDAALKEAAPDGGAYLSGQHTFYEYLGKGVEPIEAIKEALLKCSPDMTRFQAGFDKFHEVVEPSKLPFGGVFHKLGDKINGRIPGRLV